ncbi:hypothetical protein FTX61_17160 [Nitriliruptoraceae bacterium ZYF776]|nr:hypothetical protein [Profundirhabdus halotolerans]
MDTPGIGVRPFVGATAGNASPVAGTVGLPPGRSSPTVCGAGTVESTLPHLSFPGPEAGAVPVGWWHNGVPASPGLHA